MKRFNKFNKGRKAVLATSVSQVNYSTFSYRQLQSAAKAKNIRANLSRNDLIEALGGV